MIVNDELVVNGHRIDTSQIDFITPYKTSPPHSLLILEFHLKDNSQLKCMDRPKTIFYNRKIN